VKISRQELENSQVALEIEVDPSRVERALDQAYRRAAGRLKVPGFRPGKAPRPLVERILGREALLEDAIEHLVPEVYREAVETERLDPVDQPTFDVLETEPLRVKAVVPVRPQVQLGNYRAVRRTLEVPPVTDEQVAEVLEQLRESHATWVPVERPVQLGDRVAMDVRGTVGDRVLVARQDVEYVVRADEARPLPGFAAQLVSMAPGDEREFTLHVPEEFPDQSLAGQEAHFRVKLHWVKEKQLPELDDAFASTVGTFSSLEDLREQIRNELRTRAEATAQRELQERVLEDVVSGATFELPPQLVARQAARLRDELTAVLDNRGVTIEQYRQAIGKTAAELDDDFERRARQELARTFVLAAVADAEQIAVDPAEVEAEIRAAVAREPNPQRAFRAAMAQPETRRRVEAALRERKALAHLVDLATGRVASEAAASSPAVAKTEEPSHA
jgi:trigger factor